MGLFDKKTCEHCGSSAGLISRMRLKDKTFICGKCCEKIPKFVMLNFLMNMDYKDFADYISFRVENKKRLESFNVTHKYFNKILIDMNKGWFVFDYDEKIKDRASLISENPDIFEMKDLVYFDAPHIITDHKVGLVNDKIFADIRIIMVFRNKWYPYSFNQQVAFGYPLIADTKGIINVKIKGYEEHPQVAELEAYCNDIIDANEVNIPYFLGDKLTMNYDFEPYAEYFTILYKLNKLGVYSLDELDTRIKSIVPSVTLRHKIKNAYGK